MPPPSLPPNPCLIAIILTIKTHTEPRLVFHYPPNPSTSGPQPTAHPGWFGAGTDASSTGDDDNGTFDHAEVDEFDDGGDEIMYGTGAAFVRPRSLSARTHPGSVGANTNGHDDDDGSNGTDREGKDGQDGGGWRPPWYDLLGYKTEALGKMLAPTRAFDRVRFEVSVEGMVFLGRPMFSNEDGYWRKRHRSQDKHGDGSLSLSGQPMEAEDSSTAPTADEKGIAIPPPKKVEKMEYPRGFEPGYGHGNISGAPSMATSDAGSEPRSVSSTSAPIDEMSMFNVVFVLNPQALEYQLRVTEMYKCVVKQFGKALKQEQSKHGYVWKESRKIMALKTKAKDTKMRMSKLWTQIISTSPLARAIVMTYDAISRSKIAHVHLTDTLDVSFQIPQPMSTPYAPTPTEPQLPGLWLTTANLAETEELDVNFSQTSALLFLEEPETLIREIEREWKGQMTPLPFYIRHITPTKSLQRLSQMHNIPLTDIQYIAHHLIYWRRARAIPPLHQRDTYIVSPNANMRRLPTATAAYAARFPTLPSLPKMLSMLSGQPRPYTLLIPSKDHRPAYMEILAWLMRGGWVTQLRTFAWVNVSAQVKAEVAAIMEREARIEQLKTDQEHDAEVARLAESALNMTSPSPKVQTYDANRGEKRLSASGGSTPLRRSPHSGASDTAEARGDPPQLTSPRLTAQRSPAMSAVFRSPKGPPSDAGSISSGRTAVPLRSMAAASPTLSASSVIHRPSPLQKAYPSSPPQLYRQQDNPDPVLDSEPLPPIDPSKFSTSLVLSPQKASALEARWLEHIGGSFDDGELKELWPVLLKYFDGRHALDDIAVREGLKRKRVQGLLAELKEGGWLFSVRHW